MAVSLPRPPAPRKNASRLLPSDWATALGIVYVAVPSFEQLAGAFVLGVWPCYTLSVLAVFILRRRLPRTKRPYRALAH